MTHQPFCGWQPRTFGESGNQERRGTERERKLFGETHPEKGGATGPDFTGDHNTVAMSRVEESDHVEMTSGEGKEEAVQLNGAGAARASIPGFESVLRGFVRFFLYPLFRAIEINRCWETKSCVGVSHRPLPEPF